MGGNNDFFLNFERYKYLKKLPSIQRVKSSPMKGLHCSHVFVDINSSIYLLTFSYNVQRFFPIFQPVIK